jgi:hypothetical protein
MFYVLYPFVAYLLTLPRIIIIFIIATIFHYTEQINNICITRKQYIYGN